MCQFVRHHTVIRVAYAFVSVGINNAADPGGVAAGGKAIATYVAAPGISVMFIRYFRSKIKRRPAKVSRSSLREIFGFSFAQDVCAGVDHNHADVADFDLTFIVNVRDSLKVISNKLQVIPAGIFKNDHA